MVFEKCDDGRRCCRNMYVNTKLKGVVVVLKLFEECMDTITLSESVIFFNQFKNLLFYLFVCCFFH